MSVPIDLASLKALAQQAKDYVGVEHTDGPRSECPGCKAREPVERFDEIAKPDVILALVEEVERLREERQANGEQSE